MLYFGDHPRLQVIGNSRTENETPCHSDTGCRYTTAKKNMVAIHVHISYFIILILKKGISCTKNIFISTII